MKCLFNSLQFGDTMNACNLIAKPVQKRAPKLLIALNSIIGTTVAECTLVTVAVTFTVVAIVGVIIAFRRQTINARLETENSGEKTEPTIEIGIIPSEMTFPIERTGWYTATAIHESRPQSDTFL